MYLPSLLLETKPHQHLGFFPQVLSSYEAASNPVSVGEVFPHLLIRGLAPLRHL